MEITPPQADAQPLLEVNGLEKSFRSRGVTVRAVNGVTFSVARGETVALVGESGCGKSTTARCIVRLTEPNAGRIRYADVDVSALSQRAFRALRQDIQMVFQDPNASLNPSMSIRQTLREPLKLHGIETDDDFESQLQELIRRVQLEPSLLNRRPYQLSGGQKQRVVIARAIATQPSFVVLDEPTSSLDMSLRVTILELLIDLQRQFGMTYLFITHDFSTVRHFADRVVVMYRGKIMESGPAANVLDKPKHPYTRALIAAVPVPDPRRERERAPLRGEMPSTTTQIVGCPFQDRCVHVLPECREGAIPFFRAASQEVACLLYANGAAGLLPTVADAGEEA